MKKGLSKFISTVLAACMITTGVAVVPLLLLQLLYMQQAEFQSQKAKAGLKVLTLNGLLVIHLTQAIMLMLRSQAILAGHSLTTHLSEDILIVGEQTL